MAKTKVRQRYPFDNPGTYRIRLIGHLDESWAERLGGMSIEETIRGDQGSITTLAGRMRDQAELVGVVNTLYELHLTLLSVENIDDC